MTAVFVVFDAVLGFYVYVLIASVILSWLTAFGIINSYQPFVQSVGRFLHALTEPILGRIRRLLPPMSGIDLSPLLLFFLIYFVRILLRADVAPLFGVYY